MRCIDLSGKRFGRLVVLERAGAVRNGAGTTPVWRVRCDCGRETTVRGGSLRKGVTQSCGCTLRPHGMFGTSEYSAWTAMIQRCENPKNSNFPGYGGRGISVCPRWRKSFKAFLEDMGRKPSSDLSLERKDNSRGYEPSNCVWATKTEQQRNRRMAHLLTVNGETLCLSAWSERTGIGTTTLQERLRRGWDASRAVTTPVK